MEKEEKKSKSNLAGTLGAILVFVLLILIGALMLFMPDMKLIYFCYVAGGFFLAWGLWLIIRYFGKKEYKVVANYDFSIGTLVTILGVCTLVRAVDVSKVIYIYIGIMILVEAVIMLQHSIQLKSMNGSLWTLNLFFSIVFIIFSVVILLDAFSIVEKYSFIMYVGLLVIGVLGIFSQIAVAVRNNKYTKEQELSKSRTLDDEDIIVVPSKVRDKEPIEAAEKIAIEDYTSNIEKDDE